jgi:hypothetical protein
MAGGVLCLIVYLLLALRQPTTFDMGPGKLLLYAGLSVLPLGAIILWFGIMKDDKR